MARGQAVTLTPTSLAFSNQLVNTTSGVQTVSVLNSGTAELTFAAGSVTLSGTNAADFAIVSSSCNQYNYYTSLPTSACSVGVTFTPSIVGTETATLNLADNAADSPQRVSLIGTGVSSPPTITPLPTNETILFNFDGTATNYAPSPTGDAPSAGLTRDSSGNLYGTTSQGGTSVWGAVFELVNSSGSYTEKVLHSFAGPPFGGAGADGTSPASSLIIDSSGNLYGTTQGGGAYGLGTVFELVNSSGTYTEKTLYNFTGANGDGAIPFAVDLVMDAAGDLYGTTLYGGSYVGNICADNGCGTVFELVNSPESPGTYTEKVLYRFTDNNGDTNFPQTGLAMDQAGNLYGTSAAGGAGGWGAVYELVNSSGSYKERVIYSFVDINVYAGDAPAYPVIVDAAGNLYGTTPGGGARCAAGPTGCGTAFELVNSPTSPGTYMERILGNFMGDRTVASP